MKNLGLLILIVILVTSCQTKEAKINVITKEISLGNVPINTSKEFYIKLKNEGTDNLQILNVEPSCKCMIKEKKEIVIPPNQVDSIKLELTSNEYGDFKESIAIISNTKPNFSIVHVKSNTSK